jgi:hypothetical protein
MADNSLENRDKSTGVFGGQRLALLVTLGKILESIIATRIAWAVEEYGILPKTHLGGRKRISVDHVIQLILDRVHCAWGTGTKASMLLLDVAGAYDNVSHERLLHNIRRLRLGQFAPWIASFLSGRSTRIKPPGHLSDSFPRPPASHKARQSCQFCSFYLTRR